MAMFVRFELDSRGNREGIDLHIGKYDEEMSSAQLFVIHTLPYGRPLSQ